MIVFLTFNSPETGVENMAVNQSEGRFSGDLQIITSIFPLTIGILIGVLGGVGLSSLADNARVSTATHDVLNERNAIRPIAPPRRPVEKPHHQL